jgi:murein DD-endopeptidase MepM/ murein hydrolase activator NlpD
MCIFTEHLGMNKKTTSLILTTLPLLLVVVLIIPSFISSGLAQPLLQATSFPTPTPGPDGRILYSVQAGDTLYSISITAGISIDELRALNNLDAGETTIIAGQVLLLGYGASLDPPTATFGAGSSEQESTPTPEGPGTGTICVFVFEDTNGNAMREEIELWLSDGAISVSERLGKYSQTANISDYLENLVVTGATTEEPEPLCFEELPIGNYNITVAIPDDYNPTKNLNATVELTAGDEVYLNFGAQLGSEAQFEEPTPEEGGRSPLLGIVGVFLLLGAGGLGVYSIFVARKK